MDNGMAVPYGDVNIDASFGVDEVVFYRLHTIGETIDMVSKMV